MIFFLIIGVLLGAVSVIFALQNVNPVTVSFFAWTIDGSLSVILLGAMLLGVLVCTLFTIPEVIITHFRFRRLNNENKRLIGELESQQQLIDKANQELSDRQKHEATTHVTTERTTVSELNNSL